MEKISLILADTDEEYIRYFTSFIRNSEFSKNLVIQSYSQLDKLLQRVEQPNDKALLLVCPSWIPQIKRLKENSILVVLDDIPLQRSDDAIPAVFKFQPLNELLSKLLNIYYEEHQGLIDPVVKQAVQVISFFSSIGGCGKTTAAINLVKQLSELHKKVFYLNLEAISSMELFMEISEVDEFAQLIYYAKSKSHKLSIELSKLVKYNPDLKCDYIHPLQNVKDIEDVECSDIHDIIQSLIGLQQYDVIVIDLDSSLHPRIWSAMEASHNIIWLLTDDVQCKLKTQKIWKELSVLYEMDSQKISAKNHFTINKYTGSLVNRFEEDGIPVTHYLPYIPQWKSVQESRKLMDSDMFNRSILELYRNVQGIREEVLYG